MARCRLQALAYSRTRRAARCVWPHRLAHLERDVQRVQELEAGGLLACRNHGLGKVHGAGAALAVVLRNHRALGACTPSGEAQAWLLVPLLGCFAGCTGLHSASSSAVDLVQRLEQGASQLGCQKAPLVGPVRHGIGVRVGDNTLRRQLGCVAPTCRQRLLPHHVQLGVGVGGKAVDGHHHGYAKPLGVLDVARQVTAARAHQLQVLWEGGGGGRAHEQKVCVAWAAPRRAASPGQPPANSALVIAQNPMCSKEPFVLASSIDRVHAMPVPAHPNPRHRVSLHSPAPSTQAPHPTPLHPTPPVLYAWSSGLPATTGGPPPCILSARTVATMTMQSGDRPLRARGQPQVGASLCAKAEMQ